ncbi:MAG: endolytic transglycosylase MltG [Deltaproteobacteria bacterium]|nr:endolytic transglycosylase MltG [Deltaproteobacteria bacterium]MBW2419794.1 endolytic transglycosylase MltG [Deltaproteobacteria bacterium]
MKLSWIAAALLGALLLSAGSAAAWWSRQLQPASLADESVRLFVVERGDALGHVARKLESERFIRNASALKLLARWRGDAGRLRAGEYDLSSSWSTRTILDRITAGRVRTYEMVLPEGIRADEIGLRLEAVGVVEAEDFLAAVHDADFARSLGVEADNLEGYLYPETYRLSRDLSPRDVARILVEQFDRVWVEIEPTALEQTMTRHEIVTLASIVEKETAVPEERPLIAAVFLNRLRRGMRLETDPAVIYGIPDFDGNIKKKHLRDASNPYNTYKIAGLPPGPIASPGIDALRAVLEPAESEYLYFVSRNDGTHHFSRSYREHVNAVNRYQKRRRRAP